MADLGAELAPEADGTAGASDAGRRVRRRANTVEPAPEREPAPAPDGAERGPSRRPGDVPPPLARRYFTQSLRGGGVAFFEGPGAARAAFHDHGGRLSTDQSHPALARDLAAIAAHRGWTTLQVRGEDEFRREVWMEARALGLEVRGYKPRERDQQALDRRLDAARTRAERASGGAQRSGHEPRPSPESPPAPGRPTAQADRPLAGVLLGMGEAPYRRRPQAPPTPFLRLAREDGGVVDVWGAGLPGALARVGARPGDRLIVRRDGVERVAERGPKPEPAAAAAVGRRAARETWAARAERLRSAAPADAARDPDLAGAQSHLAILGAVIDRAVRDPKRRAQLRAEARDLVAAELAEGRRFAPARVREVEPALARDLAAAQVREAAPERARRR